MKCRQTLYELEAVSLTDWAAPTCCTFAVSRPSIWLCRNEEKCEVNIVNLRIIAVGKIKESSCRTALPKLPQKTGGVLPTRIVELKEESFKEPLSEKERLQIVTKEGERILGRLREPFFCLSWIPGAEALSSEELAEASQPPGRSGDQPGRVCHRGSLGFGSPGLTTRDFVLSFPKFTFPHQLMRLILTEQLYRAMTIIRGEHYHK